MSFTTDPSFGGCWGTGTNVAGALSSAALQTLGLLANLGASLSGLDYLGGGASVGSDNTTEINSTPCGQRSAMTGYGINTGGNNMPDPFHSACRGTTIVQGNGTPTECDECSCQKDALFDANSPPGPIGSGGSVHYRM